MEKVEVSMLLKLLVMFIKSKSLFFEAHQKKMTQEQAELLF